MNTLLRCFQSPLTVEKYSQNHLPTCSHSKLTVIRSQDFYLLKIKLRKQTYYCERDWGVSSAIYHGSPKREQMHHAQCFPTSTYIFIDLANFTSSINETNQQKKVTKLELKYHVSFSSCVRGDKYYLHLQEGAFPVTIRHGDHSYTLCCM